MSLAARITDRPESINGYPCSVANLFADVEAKGQAELAALQVIMYGRAGLNEPRHDARGWTEAEIFKTVTAEGYKVARNQINQHRGKRCRCYRDAR